MSKKRVEEMELTIESHMKRIAELATQVKHLENQGAASITQSIEATHTKEQYTAEQYTSEQVVVRHGTISDSDASSSDFKPKNKKSKKDKKKKKGKSRSSSSESNSNVDAKELIQKLAELKKERNGLTSRLN